MLLCLYGQFSQLLSQQYPRCNRNSLLIALYPNLYHCIEYHPLYIDESVATFTISLVIDIAIRNTDVGIDPSSIHPTAITNSNSGTSNILINRIIDWIFLNISFVAFC